jgi:pimeloyl-ACP methyl ester carboxylesterase
VQTNLEAEINHQIIKLIRDGKVAGRKFSNVIYVGHSLGSLIGSVSARRHPADSDTFVLTGWSTDAVGGLVRLLPAVPFPAALAKPKEFAGLPLGYLVFTVKEAVRRVFFGADGTFDPALQERDWRRRNTCTLGELLTAFNGVTPVAEYDRPVHVVIGDSDALFCPNEQCKPGPENTPGGGVHSFPSSSNYTYTVIPDTGHILNLHYSAQDTFRAAHEFMRYNIG